MKAFRILLAQELRQLLVVPGTYMAGVMAWAVLALPFSSILDAYSSRPQEDPPTVVLASFFLFTALFLAPLLTMRSFAEERRAGTLEALLTAPVSVPAVVLAKYCAALLLHLAIWVGGVGLDAWIISRTLGAPLLGEPGVVLAAMIFVAGAAALFTAVGILTSTLCRSQLVSAVICFALLLGLTLGIDYLFGHLGEGGAAEWIRAALAPARLFGQAEAFGRGVVDARSVVFHLTATAAVLYLAMLSLETRIAKR